MAEKTVDIKKLRENIIKLKQATKINEKRTKCSKRFNKREPKICAVVKANAYGHGYKQVCEGIADLVDFFAVANKTEALQVRALKQRRKILMLGKFESCDLELLISKGIRLTVDTLSDVESIKNACIKLNKKAFVHIKLNTGMNRLGVKTNLQLSTLLNKIDQCSYINIEGIFTHFATAESKNSYKLKRQNAKFLSMLELVKDRKLIVHASNSCAFLKSNKYCYDMIRVGLAMYGYDNTQSVSVQPCLNVRAKVVRTQTLQKGETVGYGVNFTAPTDMQIAVVGIGYADGVARAYEKGYVLICGQKCKIVGHICMDMLMCDITNLSVKKAFTCSGIFDKVVDDMCENLNIQPDSKDEMLMFSFKSIIDKVFPHNYNLHKTLDDLNGVNDSQLFATVLGCDKEEEITAKQLANYSNTIEYEVLTNFNLARL